jgi:hypothetical protein
MIINTSKRVLAAALIVVLISPFALPVSTVRAQTVEAPGPLLTAAITTATADLSSASASGVSAALDVEQNIVTKILNAIAWAVAKTAIQSITKSMVNWINSGFQGSPAFVTDLEYNLGRLQDTIADDFFDSLADNTGIDVRSPFQDQISDYLRQSYYRSTGTDGFWSRNLYDAHENEEDAEAYLGGDFSRGGWDAWMKTVLNDNNNPVGAFFTAQDELFNKIESTRVTRLNELQWGRGFLSWRGDCIQTEAMANAAQDASNVTSLDNQATPLAAKEKCLKYDIKTASSPLRQLELADSINEIVGAVVGQMVNQVLGGVGLSGLSNPSQGGGRSYVDRASETGQYDNADSVNMSAGLATAIEQELARLESLKADMQACNTSEATEMIAEIDTAIANTQQVLARARTAADSNSDGDAANITSVYQNLLATNPQSPSADELSCSS